MIFLRCLLLMIMTSCGYQAGPSGALAPYQTISIPYVKNDEDGRMTATLIKVVSTDSGLQYEKCGGDVTLLVDMVEFEDDNIGFRYDYKDDGRRRNSIIPTETRLTIVAKVTLIDSSTGTVLGGPAFINANVDFDHEYEKTRNGVNVFSLGQLTDYDEASDAAYNPAYRILSQKIADFILNL